MQLLNNYSQSYYKRLGDSTILPWLMCGLAAFFYCYEFFLRVTPSVIVGTLMHIYQLHATQFGMLSAFYYYAYTPLQLIVGSLVDMHGTRRLLTLSVLLCVLGSYLFIATTYLWVAELGRFLTGFGSAFAFVSVLRLAADWLPPKRFALISGLTTTLGMLGAISGEVLLMRIINRIGWYKAMMIAIAIGLILALAIWMLIRDHHKTSKINMNQEEIKHLMTCIMRVARQTQMWLNGAIGGILFMPTSVFAVIWGIPYLERTLHVSSQQAANMNTMIFWGWAIGGPIMGWLSDSVGSRRILLRIGSFVATVLISILFYMPNLSPTWVYPLLFSFGIASSVQVLVFAIGHELAPANLAGTAVAFTNMLVMVGGALFPPIIGMLLDCHWNGQMAHGIPIYHNEDYQIAFAIIPISLAIGFIATFCLKETHCHLQPSDPDVYTA